MTLQTFLLHLHSYLPFESVEFTIPPPSVSINISAAPSLSFILKWIKQTVIYRMINLLLRTAMKFMKNNFVLPYTAQCKGLKEFPSIFWKTSCSRSSSTQLSWPKANVRVRYWKEGKRSNCGLQWKICIYIRWSSIVFENFKERLVIFNRAEYSTYRNQYILRILKIKLTCNTVNFMKFARYLTLSEEHPEHLIEFFTPLHCKLFCTFITLSPWKQLHHLRFIFVLHLVEIITQLHHLSSYSLNNNWWN